MQMRDRCHQRQAQPGAGPGAVGGKADETLLGMEPVFARNARADIGNYDLDHRPLAAGTDGDFARRSWRGAIFD